MSNQEAVQLVKVVVNIEDLHHVVNKLILVILLS